MSPLPFSDGHGNAMDDAHIRAILIEYLKASDEKIRIYQEKSIGASICDVMAVTDKLSGYEIKSDVDNLERLRKQIASYDLFFDRCYIVCGRVHEARLEELVPSHWGILCVTECSITLVRKAKPNRSVQRRRQLSILWKIELKNILVKNGLPLYAQKSKSFIADRISEAVPDDRLGPQIAKELMSRDYSLFDADDPTIHAEGSSARLREVVDALSEEDLRDMSLDQWIALFRRAKDVAKAKESAEQAAPIVRKPHAITYKGIEPSMGAPWIAKEIIQEFICALLELNEDDRRWCIVEHDEVTGSWFVRNKSYLAGRSQNAVSKYGLPGCNALTIIEATLNLREIKVHEDASTGRIDEQATIAALEKQRLITERFAEWIWEDEDRRWEVEEAYNQLFSFGEKPTYDGSQLELPELAPDMSLFPYQKDAVQRILAEPNTLLAFDVGAGKTYIMIAAAMEMRRRGISRKNMFVVPNHIVGQWEKIFCDLYPHARILAVEPKAFKPGTRQKVLHQMLAGDYDGIIIACSCFEQIPFSSDAVLADMQRQLDRIQKTTEAMVRSSWTDACRERETKHLRKLAEDFLKSMEPVATGDITFDDLEIGTLFVDEAHNYKNLPIQTRLRNLRGINTKGSMKCLDMLHKVRYVQEHGRGAVFATGTPLCNSISDAYAMQVYLDIDELERTQLDIFDNWVRTFAKPEQLFEIDVNASRYRMVRKFARFCNLPELSAMFSRIAIFHAADKEGLPEVEERRDIVIKRSPELAEYMASLCVRSEKIRSGHIDPRYDNMLKVSTDGRKAALDLTLVGRTQPRGGFCKIDRCTEEVWKLYSSEPGTTQVIFCDLSTPKGDRYNVYRELKDRLCTLGIPAKAIAFIHSYTTEERKLALYRKFNEGTVRILIGSTFKLGTGANIQARLRAIHHLDVPWRPADMIQREGRMIRQVNTCSQVQIFRYVTEGSFDSYSWQVLETKQRFISQFLNGTSPARTASDLEDNVLSYAEVKALALADAGMKQLAEKENEAKRMRILAAELKERRESLVHEKAELEKRIKQLEERYKATIENARFFSEHSTKESRKAARKLLCGMLTDDYIQDPQSRPIDVLGFSLSVPEEQDKEKPFVLLSRTVPYQVPMGSFPAGNAQRVLNMLTRLEKTAQDYLNEKDSIKSRADSISKSLASWTDPYTPKAEALEREIDAIRWPKGS